MLTSLKDYFSASSEADMARTGKFDEVRVKSYTDRLKSAGTERSLFDKIVGDIRADEALTATDLKAIAHRYVGGGKQPATKTAALSALATRFAELVRTKKNLATAEKVRPL